MSRALIIIFFSSVLLNCSDSTNPDNNHFGFPTNFPLESGTAWIYENHSYETDNDSIWVDTLYVIGKHDDYYKISWMQNNPHITSLIKNSEGLLLNIGYIIEGNSSDTVFYNRPYIEAYFREDTGYVDINKYEDYLSMGDSIHIGHVKNIELFDNTYDGIVISRNLVSAEFGPVCAEDTYITEGISTGFLHSLRTGELLFERILVKRINDFYPENSFMKYLSPKQKKLDKLSENKFNRENSSGLAPGFPWFFRLFWDLQ